MRRVKALVSSPRSFAAVCVCECLTKDPGIPNICAVAVLRGSALGQRRREDHVARGKREAREAAAVRISGERPFGEELRETHRKLNRNRNARTGRILVSSFLSTDFRRAASSLGVRPPVRKSKALSLCSTADLSSISEGSEWVTVMTE